MFTLEGLICIWFSVFLFILLFYALIKTVLVRGKLNNPVLNWNCFEKQLCIMKGKATFRRGYVVSN